MDLNRIVIAGGGTGGHIYPAVAIARAVQVLSPAAEITFVGAQGGLEERLIPREGFSLRLLSVGKLNQKEDGWIGKLRTLLRLPLAMFVSWKILREIQPQVVLGVGGYASGPFVLVASLLGYRTAIWEPNAHPGLTNRWLSRFVGKAYVVFREADRHLKCRKVMQIGMPVRPAVESLASLPTEEIPHRPFRILMIGGSQGAQSLNRIVAEAFAKLSESGEFEILHQTGQLDYENVKHRYGSLPNIRAEPFLYDMEKHLAWADLLVCRSGASTVAEIAAAGRPAIFVPLPWAADDHQKKNAEVLVRSEAALMFEQRALSPELLVRAIKELFAQPETLRKMAKNVKQFHQPGAANRIALDLADWAT